MGPTDRQTEAEFLAQYDPSDFERPSVAVDIVLLSVENGQLRTAVVRRHAHPFRNCWAVPGGFVGIDESLEAAATRVLHDKLGLTDVFVEQLYTFGDPDRDPRMRIISVAYYALIDRARLREDLTSHDDLRLPALEVPWEGETGGAVELVDDGRSLKVAFDHDEIVGMAVKRIRGKLDYTPIGFQLLPQQFTLRQLQTVHETVLGRPLNKDSFRRRMLASGQLEATGERQRDVDHRPAEKYRFSKRSAV